MSVSLVVENGKPDKEVRLIPVATEKVFEDYWRPACLTLGLKWIPLFQSGLPLTGEDVPYVLTELARLRCYLLDSTARDIPRDVAEGIILRIDNVVTELKHLRENPAAHAYVS